MVLARTTDISARTATVGSSLPCGFDLFEAGTVFVEELRLGFLIDGLLHLDEFP